MSIKVVRGIINNSNKSNSANNNAINRSVSGKSQVLVTKSPFLGSSDATVNALRNSKGTLTRDAIREEKEARGIAKDVADELRELDSPESIHEGLAVVDTRGHFSEE